MKMQRTIVIRRDYLHYIRKHNRFEKRHKNMSVHLSPCFRDVQIGDIVTVESRLHLGPLSGNELVWGFVLELGSYR
uniref:40S ribosomal protein S11 N-terminal domain-containing protein n=1 Tax=Callithrix jacchus TaxID=9483 RepID=A0A8I3WLY9_CALJA